MTPHACTGGQSYTFYFNLVFYSVIVWAFYLNTTANARAVCKGVAVHVFPFLVVSEYVMWGRSCGANVRRPWEWPSSAIYFCTGCR